MGVTAATRYVPIGPCTCGKGPWPNGDYCDNCGGSRLEAGAGARARTHLVHKCAQCGAIITRTGRGRPPKLCSSCAKARQPAGPATYTCEKCKALIVRVHHRGRPPRFCASCKSGGQAPEK